MPICEPSEESIAAAATMLRAGRLVAFPTETVYGLGADATNERAVASIFEVKGRPQFNPLIVHVLSTAAARDLAEFSAIAEQLAARFWPGPLTLVLPRRPDCKISWLVTAGLDTIAVRVPSNPIARSLLEAVGKPLAAPSANPSGNVSPTLPSHVSENLGSRIELIIDGGPTSLGLESTIIGCFNGTNSLLRPGAITRDEIERITGPLAHIPDHNAAPHSPGRLKRHYATSKPLRLNATTVTSNEALLAFGPPIPGASVTRNLSVSMNLQEAAGNLFAMLRELDKTNVRSIAVMPIPIQGLGESINDRLERAATRE